MKNNQKKHIENKSIKKLVIMDHKNKITKFIKKVYTSECKGKQNGVDKCNCFLHSYSSHISGVHGNKFQTLKPYIEYVVLIHPEKMELTISVLKQYAKSFSSTTLDFSTANF